MEHYFIQCIEWVSDHWRIVGLVILIMTMGLMVYVGRIFIKGLIDDIGDCWK